MRVILYWLVRVVAVVLMAGALAWFAERRLDRAAEAKSFTDVGKVPATDVALVLGTSAIGPEGGPNRYFVYRLDAAAALYKAGKVKYFIVSGAREPHNDEPTAMRDGLVARGVPADVIYRDFNGDRTLAARLRPDPAHHRLAALSPGARAVPGAARRHRRQGLRGARRRPGLQHLHRTQALSLGPARLLGRVERPAVGRHQQDGPHRRRSGGLGTIGPRASRPAS